MSERHARQRTLSRLTTIAISVVVSYGQTSKANRLYGQYLTNNGDLQKCDSLLNGLI